jgi:hypothetical protein
MPKLGLGLSLPQTLKVGAPVITTSRAFNSSGVQVGSTNTGSIPDLWVYNQTTITSVIFANNNSVTSIGYASFSNCESLPSITIPSSVTSVGGSAFNACSSLNTVSCYVAQSAFVGTNTFLGTASPLTIRARSTDASWTAGTGLTFQGNTNVTVIKDL